MVVLLFVFVSWRMVSMSSVCDYSDDFVLKALRWYYPRTKFFISESGILMGKDFMFDGIYNVFTVSDDMKEKAIVYYGDRQKHKD